MSCEVGRGRVRGRVGVGERTVRVREGRGRHRARVVDGRCSTSKSKLKEPQQGLDLTTWRACSQMLHHANTTWHLSAPTRQPRDATIRPRPLSAQHKVRSDVPTANPPRTMAVPRIAHLSHKSVLELSGPDAQKFLKGLSCKDVEYLAGGYSGFLNASGRVLHTAFVFPRSKNSYLITHESPEDHPTPLASHFPPFKLRSKVRIKDVTNQWDAWSAWGSDLQGGPSPIRTWKMGSGGASESHWDWEGGVRDLGLRDNEVGCWDLRAGWPHMGRQLLVPKGEKRTLIFFI